MSEAKSIFIYFYASSMDVKIRVCLPRKYGRFMLCIDNNLLLEVLRVQTRAEVAKILLDR
jgi:hypothetical protein